MNASKDESDFNTASSSFVSFFCLLGDDDDDIFVYEKRADIFLRLISFCSERDTMEFLQRDKREKHVYFLFLHPRETKSPTLNFARFSR